jgi:leucyl aminopeptidase (aminopeptidase T)
MDLRLGKLVRHALTPYRLNLEPGQRVLIVTDTETDPLVREAFRAAAAVLELEAVVTVTDPVPHHHADLDPAVLAAIDEVDVVHLITSKGTLHGATAHAKQLAGKRFLASEELTAEMLAGGACSADYDAMGEVADLLYKEMTNADTIRITSDLGTDLRGSIAGRPCWITAGRILENPGVDLFACGFPDGEVATAPIEDTIEGTVVWDASMHHVGLLGEPIKATVEAGRVTSLEGGREASVLRTYLETNGDEGSWIIGETAIGVNPDARVTGIVREDKKLAGSVHVALGMNVDTGGTVDSRTHVDGVIRRPTVTVGETTLVEDGELRVDR